MLIKMRINSQPASAGHPDWLNLAVHSIAFMHLSVDGFSSNLRDSPCSSKQIESES